MTPQEVFDKVARHLLTQNSRSMNTMPGGSDGCAYRGRDGKMCAFGCLIPDDCYSPTLENSTAVSILKGNFPFEPRDLVDEDAWRAAAACVRSRLGDDCLELRHLIQQLQDIHDVDLEGPVNWRDQLRETAERFDLDDSVLDEVA